MTSEGARRKQAGSAARLARLSRRDALVLAATSLAGAACGGRKREPWESGPRLRSGHPILRMPFPAGTMVLCQQGNLSPEGRTHFKENSRHAIDFSNATVAPLEAVAAAPGRVAYVYGGAPLEDTKAGFGFGNHVKVEHGDGYFTMYAHLALVFVSVGDFLDVAAPLGTVGYTGAAGNRHLHFSLHQGNPEGMGVYETTAMDALVTLDPSWPDGFRMVSSVDLRDGQVDIWGGGLYGSENHHTRPPLVGAPPLDLGAALQASRAALEEAVRDRSALDALARSWEQKGADWCRALVLPILELVPRHAVARYWFATAVEMPEQKWAEAEARLADLLSTGPAEPTWEPWIASWAHNRLGTMALKKEDTAAARAHFKEAARRATVKPARDFALTALSALEGK